MFYKKEIQFDLNELEQAAKAYRSIGVLSLPVNSDEHLNGIIENIKAGYQREMKQYESMVDELSFLTNELKMGYLQIFIHSSDMDADTNYIKVDSSVLTLLGDIGNEGEEISLHHYFNYIHPDDVDQMKQSMHDYIVDSHTSNAYEHRYRLLMKAGEYRWVRHFSMKESVTKNELILKSFILDIDEQYTMSRELSSTNTRYSLINAAMTEAPWDMVVDLTSKFPLNESNEFWWSDQYRKLLGFKNEHDFPNVMSSWTNLLHPEDVAQAQQDMNDYLMDFSGNTEYHSKFRLKNKTGSYSWYQSEGAALRDEKGYPIRVAGTIRNIQDESMKEQNALEMKNRVSDLAEAISEMVTGITSINMQAQDLAQTQEESIVAAMQVQTAAEKTKGISEFIRGIAEETNLLGLNAAIEAARAGEHGKGFGVVAEQVRKLAVNSKEATSNIEETLEYMQKSIESIFEQMNKLSDLTQSQAALTEEVNASVEEINAMGERVVEFGNQ